MKTNSNPKSEIRNPKEARNPKPEPARHDSVRGPLESSCAAAFLALVILLAATGLAHGQSIPALINYQGRLTDNLGNPVTSGSYDVQFRIWDHPTQAGAGDYIWGRSFPLHVVTNGLFNILLSDDGGLVTTPGTPQAKNLLTAFAGPDRYLGLTITRNPAGQVTTPVEISPRQQLVSAPYAIHAQDATTATFASFATNANDAQHLAGLASTQFLAKAAFPTLLTQPKSVLKWGTGPTPSKSGIFDYDGKVLITTNASGPSEPANGVALQVSGGAVRPAFGAANNAGLRFPEDPAGGSGDAAWVRYYLRTGTEDCSLQVGITNDPGDNLELVASGNVGVTAGAKTTIEAPGVDIRATDLNQAVTLHGRVSMFQGMQSKDENTDYTAETDGFIMISIYILEAEVIIEGQSFWMEALEDDSNNMSASFPVRKGAVWRVNTSRKGDGHNWMIRWMPIGQ